MSFFLPSLCLFRGFWPRFKAMATQSARLGFSSGQFVPSSKGRQGFRGAVLRRGGPAEVRSNASWSSGGTVLGGASEKPKIEKTKNETFFQKKNRGKNGKKSKKRIIKITKIKRKMKKKQIKTQNRGKMKKKKT